MNKQSIERHKKNKNEKESKKGKKAFLSKFLIGAVIIVILLFIAILIITSNLRNKILIHDVLEWDAQVTDYVGFNLDSDKLHFGGVLPGGKSTRSMILQIPNEAYVYVTNEELLWVYMPIENPTFVEEGNLELKLFVKPPRGIKNDLYGSNLHVYVLNEEPSGLEKMFLKGTALEMFEAKPYTAGAKITIVNPENSTNSSIQE